VRPTLALLLVLATLVLAACDSASPEAPAAPVLLGAETDGTTFRLRFSGPLDPASVVRPAFRSRSGLIFSETSVDGNDVVLRVWGGVPRFPRATYTVRAEGLRGANGAVVATDSASVTYGASGDASLTTSGFVTGAFAGGYAMFTYDPTVNQPEFYLSVAEHPPSPHYTGPLKREVVFSGRGQPPGVGTRSIRNLLHASGPWAYYTEDLFSPDPLALFASGGTLTVTAASDSLLVGTFSFFGSGHRIGSDTRGQMTVTGTFEAVFVPPAVYERVRREAEAARALLHPAP